ncbi:MAG TPA: choice-of-anchor L domain-containing protein [Cryomorphaceae bacterium]|nr:choice-of-anchor L domain-containing protein [Cryomorphaceae bacterium]
MKNLLTAFRISFLSFGLFLSIAPFVSQAQVSVQDSLSVEYYVNEVLLGGGISASNITFNGQAADSVFSQIASFTADSSAFPIAEGVVLSTGLPIGIAGGNDFPVENTIQDDPDLVAISGVSSMNNCAILEFDFVAETDTFLIDYVFASTEYPAFTCSQFNDAFGIFLSGPGISGPFTDAAENIALIPGTDIPVAINTVNSGEMTGVFAEPCLDANPNFVEDSIYFFDNNPQLENSIAYPGHTHMLTASAVLDAGSVYHFKFAIGNAVDIIFQSAVMMRKGSVSSGLVTSELQVEVDTEGFDIAEEGVYIAGTFNYFIPEPMEQIATDLYRFSVEQPSNVNVTYKFFNGSSPNAAELVPDSCSIDGLMSGGNRFVSMGSEPITLASVCFGACGDCLSPLFTEEESSTKLGIYPNPSEGQFQIVPPADGFARIQAFDVQGRMVIDTRVYVKAGNPVAVELPAQGLFKIRLAYDENSAGRVSGTVVVN